MVILEQKPVLVEREVTVLDFQEEQVVIK